MKAWPFIFTFLFMALIVSCKKNDSGEQFPETLQAVWQDEAGSYSGNDMGVYFKENKIFTWDYLGDTFDNGEDCYLQTQIGKLVSHDGDAYRIFMQESLFTGRQEVEETIFIYNNDSWISANLESEADDERIWFKDNRSIQDIVPLCSDN